MAFVNHAHTTLNGMISASRLVLLQSSISSFVATSLSPPPPSLYVFCCSQLRTQCVALASFHLLRLFVCLSFAGSGNLRRQGLAFTTSFVKKKRWKMPVGNLQPDLVLRTTESHMLEMRTIKVELRYMRRLAELKKISRSILVENVGFIWE